MRSRTAQLTWWEGPKMWNGGGIQTCYNLYIRFTGAYQKEDLAPEGVWATLGSCWMDVFRRWLCVDPYSCRTICWDVSLLVARNPSHRRRDICRLSAKSTKRFGCRSEHFSLLPTDFFFPETLAYILSQVFVFFPRESYRLSATWSYLHCRVRRPLPPLLAAPRIPSESSVSHKNAGFIRLSAFFPLKGESR